MLHFIAYIRVNIMSFFTLDQVSYLNIPYCADDMNRLKVTEARRIAVEKAKEAFKKHSSSTSFKSKDLGSTGAANAMKSQKCQIL